MSEEPEGFFGTVALVGVGLIGGSLGMSIKRNGLAERVIGVGRSEQRLMQARILGAIDEYRIEADDSVEDADLVVICTPVRTIISKLRSFSGRYKPGAIITDVGSTKREIMAAAAECVPPHATFIGGHPMAGAEKSGVESAFPDLFLGATYVLTPTDSADLSALGCLTNLIETTGARVEIMGAEEHDRAVALVSHLPHVISAALLAQTESSAKSCGSIFRLAAGSFRDATRVSDSPPEIWRDICLSNADEIVRAIEDFQLWINSMKDSLLELDDKAIYDFFDSARGVREAAMRLRK